MNFRLPRIFRLEKETESFEVVQANVSKDSHYRGTSLWVLFFAILIASLGLNINSPAVVIGAMLISPLMGPILGLGIGVAINSLDLIKIAAKNYGFAIIVGLGASTVYFLVSPLDEAHSEILARVSPSVYDVLIALFGGFAGSLAVSSKNKGNVIPGVAIATALMPPLCTAGYGLATWNLPYFFGAFYLYLINSVFIGAATLLTAYALRFPVKKYEDYKTRKRERTIILLIVLATLLPSIYFGYDIVVQSNFREKADVFIKTEANFPNNFLLRQNVDPKRQEIVLTFGGEEINKVDIEKLESKLRYYELGEATLKVNQGFVFLNEDRDPKLGLGGKGVPPEWMRVQQQVDSIRGSEKLGEQIFKELKVMFPDLKEAILQPAMVHSDSASPDSRYLVLLNFKEQLSDSSSKTLEDFLTVRLSKQVKLVVQADSLFVGQTD